MKKQMIVAIATASLFTAPVYAKRAAAPDVKPVSFGYDICSTQFVAGQDGYEVYVECVDKETGKTSWKTRIYGEKYDDSLEHDVQDVRPVSMTLQGKMMAVTDEKGRTYKLDVMTGSIIAQ